MDSMTIEDKAGKQFWYDHFGTQPTVAWSAFTTAIENHFRIMPELLPTTVPSAKVLKYTMSRGAHQLQSDTITQVELDYFLKRFGPFRLSLSKAANSFFRNGELMKWFHGSISRADSVRILADLQPGKFLMRYSEERPRNFTLCYVNNSREVRHVLIYNYLERGYGLQPDPAQATRDETFSSIIEFVDRQRERLCRPCISSLYERFLTDNTPDNIVDIRYADGAALYSDATADNPNPYGIIDQRFQHQRTAGLSQPMHDFPEPEIVPGSEYAAFSINDSPVVPIPAFADDQNPYAPFLGSAPVPPTHVSSPIPTLPPQSPLFHPATSAETHLKTELDRARSLMQRDSEQEALDAVERIMPRVLQTNDRHVELKALRCKGEILTKMGRFDESEQAFHRCMQILHDMYLGTERQDGDSTYFPEAKALSFVHKQLADHAYRREDYDNWMYHSERMIVYDAEQRLRVTNDFSRLKSENPAFAPDVDWDAAKSQLEIGKLAYDEGQFKTAYDNLILAVRYARLTENTEIEVRGLANLGTVVKQQNDPLQAIIFYKQYLATLRKSQLDRGPEKRVLHVLVTCLMQLQQWRKALLFLDQHLKLSQRRENKEMLRKRKEEIMRHIS